MNVFSLVNTFGILLAATSCRVWLLSTYSIVEGDRKYQSPTHPTTPVPLQLAGAVPGCMLNEALFVSDACRFVLPLRSIKNCFTPLISTSKQSVDKPAKQLKTAAGVLKLGVTVRVFEVRAPLIDTAPPMVCVPMGLVTTRFAVTGSVACHWCEIGLYQR